jgi:hypothetical protein
MAICLGEDDGWLEIEVRPVDGDPVTVRCDVLREFNTLAQGETGESEGAFLAAAKVYFESIGFPAISTKTAAAIARAVNDRMAELRAKDAASAALEARVAERLRRGETPTI